MENRIIYWFRNDLRLDDNEAFWMAAGDATELLPVYVFDPRRFRLRDLGFRKTGLNRAYHILDAVGNLQGRLREKQGDLIIKVGEPEKIIADLAKLHQVAEVRASKEITLEETNVEASLSKRLKGINVDISLTWMSTLIHPHDLPVYISRLPEEYGRFAELTRQTPVRKPLPGQEVIPFMAGETGSVLPDLRELGFGEEELKAGKNPDVRSITEAELKTRVASGEAGTEEFLNWVSDGLISPRLAYHHTSGTPLGAALYDQLSWRDYLQFLALKYGTRLFKPSGLVHRIDKEWKYDRESFHQWKDGKTSDPEVNRSMATLGAKGLLGFGESKVAAQHLIGELGVNWTWGAAWFESQLMNYEVALNWGIWNYFAGVGPGKMEDIL